MLAFLWLELVPDEASSSRVVALFVTGYAIVHVIAGTVYGSRWFERGDGFELYSWLISRASPLGSTVFDGLSRTTVWSDLISGTDGAAYVVLGSAGLLGAIGAVGSPTASRSG